jgi:pimeloyl-ACP methyl ester carboxylesterase
LAGLVIVWAVSVPAPGQAVEYGRDLKFTLYSGQGETAAEFKENVILMLHGFASAMPNRTYKVLNRAFGATHTVVGFNYDYVDVAANRAELQELYDRFLEGRNLIVVGTSLGGFWANYFANHVGARGAILINPVVDPQELMRVMQGEHYSERRQMTRTTRCCDTKTQCGCSPPRAERRSRSSRRAGTARRSTGPTSWPPSAVSSKQGPCPEPR